MKFVLTYKYKGRLGESSIRSISLFSRNQWVEILLQTLFKQIVSNFKGCLMSGILF